MGSQVAKVFGGELFRGSIVDVDEDEGDGTVLYHIEYEDEDQEDLSSKDCMCRHNQTTYTVQELIFICSAYNMS